MSTICALMPLTLRLRWRYAQGERGIVPVRTGSLHELSPFGCCPAITDALCMPCAPVPLGHERADSRDQLFAELGGIGKRIEPTNQYSSHSQVIVGDNRLCDLLGCPHQRGRIPTCPRDF